MQKSPKVHICLTVIFMLTKLSKQEKLILVALALCFRCPTKLDPTRTVAHLSEAPFRFTQQASFRYSVVERSLFA